MCWCIMLYIVNEIGYSSIPAEKKHGFDPASEFLSKIGAKMQMIEIGEKLY